MSTRAANKSGKAAAEQVVVRSLWIPLQDTAVLLPNTAVAEVTDYQSPEALEDAPEWLLGVFQWRGRDVPLIAFERMLGLAASEQGRHSRIVVLNTLGDDPQQPFMAFVVHGIPRLLQLHGGMLESKKKKSGDDAAILAHVSLNDDPALIPDLDVVEQRLGALSIGRRRD